MKCMWRVWERGVEEGMLNLRRHRLGADSGEVVPMSKLLTSRKKKKKKKPISLLLKIII